MWGSAWMRLLAPGRVASWAGLWDRYFTRLVTTDCAAMVPVEREPVTLARYAVETIVRVCTQPAGPTAR